MAKVLLNQHRKKRLETGHPWIFKSEVLEIQGDVVPGEIVEVANHKGHFLAKGYINPASQMIVRILSFDQKETIDYDFFLNKIRQAAEFRTRFVDNPRACRVIYGEADFLPGLIVDRYEDILVVQVLSLGMEQRISWIRDALVEVFSPTGIYLRNDVPVRELEGLTQSKEVLYGECPREVMIEENGLKYFVDIVEGQKNRLFLRSAGKPRLDRTAYEGLGRKTRHYALERRSRGRTEAASCRQAWKSRQKPVLGRSRGTGVLYPYGFLHAERVQARGQKSDCIGHF